jgi:hypothetical protein
MTYAVRTPLLLQTGGLNHADLVVGGFINLEGTETGRLIVPEFRPITLNPPVSQCRV